MQQDHVLNKLNFDLLPKGLIRGGGGGSAGKIFATICCIGDILKFNMQHVYVLKKLYFDT